MRGGTKRIGTLIDSGSPKPPKVKLPVPIGEPSFAHHIRLRPACGDARALRDHARLHPRHRGQERDPHPGRAAGRRHGDRSDASLQTAAGRSAALAPLRHVVRPPYRPDPSRGPGRPRHHVEEDQPETRLRRCCRSRQSSAGPLIAPRSKRRWHILTPWFDRPGSPCGHSPNTGRAPERSQRQTVPKRHRAANVNA